MHEVNPTLPSGAMLAKKQASLGMFDPAAAAAMAVDPSVRLRSIDCEGMQNTQQCLSVHRIFVTTSL
jgi:hypothetical protein